MSAPPRRRAQNLSAAGISRRPRARPRRRAYALWAFPRRARANCRAGSPISCARRPAPKSRSNGASQAFVRLGEGEAQSGGRKKTAILGDICESIIGAVFLDAGYDGGESGRARAFGRACAAPRRPLRDAKDRVAGMGAGARPADAALSRGRALAARSRAAIYDRASRSTASRRARQGVVEARRRAGGRRRPSWRAKASSGGERRARDERRRREAARGETRCGFVALIGAPNAGKSTLINALVGAKVSIVSRKAQTTRSLVRGIAIEGDGADHFRRHARHFRAEAPARPRHGRRPPGAARGTPTRSRCSSMRAKGVDEEVEAILARLAASAAPKMLVLNKIDTGRAARRCWSSPPSSTRRCQFDETFMISALTRRWRAETARAARRA